MPVTKTSNVVDKFRQVYADAVENGLSTDAKHKNRSLLWHGERVSLAAAAEAYACIEHGYNEFRGDAIAKLANEFEGCGIEATLAREYSPAIYLHFPKDGVPGLPRLQSDVKQFVQKHLVADEVDTVDHFSCLQEGEAELDGVALRIWWD